MPAVARSDVAHRRRPVPSAGMGFNFSLTSANPHEMLGGMANKRKKTFYDWAAEYPPILCRLLARGSDGKPLTHEQIAMTAKMSWLEVVLLSEQTDWHRIDLPSMQTFTKACGVDFTDRMSMNRQVCYLRGKEINGRRQPPKFKYLLMAQNCQSYFKPLYERWAKSLI